MKDSRLEFLETSLTNVQERINELTEKITRESDVKSQKNLRELLKINTQVFLSVKKIIFEYTNFGTKGIYTGSTKEFTEALNESRKSRKHRLFH